MTESKICTCPSGDGSLRWPCPKHPAVEQAVGDERAAFELFVRKHCGMPEHIAVNWDAKFTNDAWEGWQARAALAQPSPMYDPKRCLACGGDHGNSGLPCPNMRVTAQAQPSPKCVKCGGTGEADSGGVHPWGEPVLIPCDCETEQAVAERPEVVAYADPVAFATFKERGHEGGVAGREWMWAEPGAALVAMSRTDECERIVGALREQYECNTAIMHARTEALSRVTSERDAALAEVAGLRSLLNSLLCYVERDIDRMRSDRDKSDNKEIYDRSISLAMERLKAAQNAVFTTEPGCDTAVELAAQTTQAQHSVPGKYDDVLLPFLKSMEHELHANAGKGDRPGWLQMDRRTALLEIYYHLAKLQKATKDNDAAGIVEYAADVANMSMMLVDVCGLLAAAPGKEGV